MISKKKILLFTDWYEPGYKAGGPIQSTKNFANAMHDSFDIFIITSDRDLGDIVPYANIESEKWISKNENVRAYYIERNKLNSSRLLALLRFVSPDFVYLNSMYSYQFTIIPLWLKFRNKIRARIIIAPRGMLHRGAMEFKSLKKKFFISLIKSAGISGHLFFHATDEQEKKDISVYFPVNAGISVITNFPKTESMPLVKIEKSPGVINCVFISRIAPKKNILFLLDLLKLLPPSVHLKLTIRGEIEDDDYWEKCMGAIQKFPSNISAIWEGAVPNNEVSEVLSRHHLFILPTKGENFGHAIFESLLSGRPVLISDQTPWRDLASQKIGWDLPLDRPELFLEAIEQMTGFDQAEYNEWSFNARKFADQYNERLNLKEEYLKLFS